MFSEETGEGEQVEQPKVDLYEFANLKQELFLSNIPQGCGEETVSQLFDSYGELLKFKFLPARDHLTGKCWIAVDSAEKATQVLADLGEQFEIDGQPVYLKISLT